MHIRKLNDMVVSDSYPFLLQSEIIVNVQECTNLAVFDTFSFFYELRLYPNHCFIFTVVTHQGPETFQVLIMGYINSIVYVQREIDIILRTEVPWPVLILMTLFAKSLQFRISLRSSAS